MISRRDIKIIVSPHICPISKSQNDARKVKAQDRTHEVSIDYENVCRNLVFLAFFLHFQCVWVTSFALQAFVVQFFYWRGKNDADDSREDRFQISI